MEFCQFYRKDSHVRCTLKRFEVQGSMGNGRVHGFTDELHFTDSIFHGKSNNFICRRHFLYAFINPSIRQLDNR